MMFSRELPTHLVTRRSVALALASDHRHGCGAQVEGLGKFPVRREVTENTDIGEHHLGGKFRRFPAEQRRQAPSGVEGDRSPVRRCGGRRPRISEPCASAPTQAAPLRNLQRFLAGRDRQRRQQEPRLAARIFLFFDMNQRNRLRLPCGRREIHHAPAQGDPCVAGLPSVFGFLATGTVTGGRISRRCRTGSARTLSNSLGRSLPSLRSCFARTSNIPELALNGEQEIAFPSPPACRRARRQVSPAPPVRCVSSGGLFFVPSGASYAGERQTVATRVVCMCSPSDEFPFLMPRLLQRVAKLRSLPTQSATSCPCMRCSVRAPPECCPD